MARDLPHHMMSRGNARERQLGRLLARGRTRMPPHIEEVFRLAAGMRKDITGAGGTTTGDAVHTDTAGRAADDQERTHTPRRETRLKLPHAKD